jgi:hypothetical protein
MLMADFLQKLHWIILNLKSFIFSLQKRRIQESLLNKQSGLI